MTPVYVSAAAMPKNTSTAASAQTTRHFMGCSSGCGDPIGRVTARQHTGTASPGRTVGCDHIMTAVPPPAFFDFSRGRGACPFRFWRAPFGARRVSPLLLFLFLTYGHQKTKKP